MANIIATHDNLTINGDGNISVALNGSGTNRLIVLIGATRGTGAGGMNSCGIGAVSAAEITNHVAALDHNSAVGIAIFTDDQHPGAGSADFTIDWSGGSHSGIVVYEIDDAPQSGPFYTEFITLIQSEITSGSSYTQNVVGESGKLAIALLAMGDGSFFGTTVAASANLSNQKKSALTYTHLETANAVVADDDEDYTFTVTLDSGGTPEQGVLGVLTFGQFSPVTNNDPQLENAEPDFSIGSDQSGVVGTVAGNMSDADSDPLTYSIVSGAPAGISMAANGDISANGSVTPGAYTITYQGDDLQGGTPAQDTFVLTVTAPVLRIDSVSAGPYRPGENLTINHSNASAAGKTYSADSIAISESAQDANSSVLPIPNPLANPYRSLTFNENISFEVVDGAESDSVQLQISPQSGFGVFTILALTGVFADAAFSALEVGDQIHAPILTDADWTIGAIPKTDSEQVLPVTVRDMSDATPVWGATPFTITVPAVAAPVNDPATGAPAINGTPEVGELLTANTSGIADSDGLGAFSYVWMRAGGAISGATSSTYTPVQADEGETLTVSVSFVDGEGNSEGPLVSAGVTVSAAAVVNNPASGAPVIDGTPEVGQTLTANVSAIADVDGLGVFSYVWMRSGVPIGGATSSTYTAVQADVGQALTVSVSFVDGEGNSEGPLVSAGETIAAVTPPNPLDAEAVITDIIETALSMGDLKRRLRSYLAKNQIGNYEFTASQVAKLVGVIIAYD